MSDAELWKHKQLAKQHLVINEKELAEILGLSAWTVRRMRIEEGCPHFVVGHRIFYRLESVPDWISEKEKGGGSKGNVEVLNGKIRRID